MKEFKVGEKPPWTLERIKSRCQINENGCWVWAGAKRPFGYGSIGIKGIGVGAHRLAVELSRGKFDKALCVLHRCDNPPCCNPDHLFLGTKRDNRLDQIKKGRDPAKSSRFCKWGHEFTQENTIVYKSGKRRCKPCQRIVQHKYSIKMKLRREVIGKGDGK